MGMTKREYFLFGLEYIDVNEHEDRVLKGIHACFMRGCAWQAFAADMGQAGADASTWQSAYFEQNRGRVCMPKTDSFYLGIS